MENFSPTFIFGVLCVQNIKCEDASSKIIIGCEGASQSHPVDIEDSFR